MQGSISLNRLQSAEQLYLSCLLTICWQIINYFILWQCSLDVNLSVLIGYFLVKIIDVRTVFKLYFYLVFKCRIVNYSQTSRA